MMSDVPWGVLLSGGLDSSLVASICARNIARHSASFPKLHSFTIGLENSPDLLAAKKVADYLGTIHHAYTYTLDEGADAVRHVIRTLETYDLTTIRASTPMYLMSRKIKACGIKMVLSGEGADEVFGGYLYFHKAPNSQELYDETVDKLSRLHMYDCLRCNKAMSAWGVEPRVPFLDADFLEVAMNLDPEEKMIRKGPGISKEDTRIEKWAVRKAFDTPEDPYLPDEILWRQKEQFSDGTLFFSVEPNALCITFYGVYEVVVVALRCLFLLLLFSLSFALISIPYCLDCFSLFHSSFPHRCRLRMGRPSQGDCRRGDFGPHVFERCQPFPVQHTDDKGGLPVPDDL